MTTPVHTRPGQLRRRIIRVTLFAILALGIIVLFGSALVSGR